MAVRFETVDPDELLSAIKSAIDEGHIETWSYDDDDDFTHTARQWEREAWMRPTIKDDQLIFNIVAPINSSITVEIYAIYHGRFIEMALAHVDHLFSSACASAQAEDDDIIKSPQ
jgi:hypothetical protein